ncbi:hypothetical protein C882_3310 [Caenispirillum salinarum AK4]|uniref:Uncharacterized protein n=1 Tax=Caenispirillum salinarum AK4 TaxID=1238182 RepID=K9HVJ2_9PROT|nr:hypothetical protein [Caenispirillum salinarum]EKV32246.1 hypothetical protein C882_3310 [Caenispirillum salinarum AK4]
MNSCEKGSVLPIMAAIVTGIGLVVAGISVFVEEEESTRLETSAHPKLERIADSLVTYYKATGALPCPADGRAGDGEPAKDASDECDANLDAEYAVVPYVALGMADALDPWGQQISYRPHSELAKSPPPSPPLEDNRFTVDDPMNVCADFEAASCTLVKSGADDAAFVIFSHGRPRAGSEDGESVYGNGAFDAAGNRNLLPQNPAELHNITTPPGDDVNYFAEPRTAPALMGGDPENDVPAEAFEQILAYREVDKDLGASDGTGGTEDDYDLDLNKDSQHDEFVTTKDESSGSDKSQPAALGERQGDNKNWVGLGNNNNDDRVGEGQNSRAACAWYPKALRWERGETMRGAFEFQFAPGEADETEDQEHGGGFTLAITAGPRRVTDADGNAICGEGNDNSNMGLGYKHGTFGLSGKYDPDFDWDFFFGGQKPPLLGTGTDLRMPKMAIEFDTFNNEYGDEDNLERNHVALLTTWDKDYIGNGNGNNPSCPTTLNLNAATYDATVPRSGTSARACTYDASLASWLEFVGKGNTKQEYPAPWFTGSGGAAPYVTRFEIARLCDDTCTTCGIAEPDSYTTNTEYKDSRDHMWVRAWVQKKEDMVTEKFLTELSINLVDIDEYKTGGRPANFINYCGKDPSMQFQNSALNQSSFRRDMVMFDTVKVGLTAAAPKSGGGAKGSGISITDLRVKLAP